MDTNSYPVPEAVKERTLITKAQYDAMYAQSVNDNEGFWAQQAKRVDWIKPFTKVKDVSYAKDDLHIRWYEDGTLNACYNCVDNCTNESANSPTRSKRWERRRAIASRFTCR
jgi:acetyl-CoA synthetase